MVTLASGTARGRAVPRRRLAAPIAVGIGLATLALTPIVFAQTGGSIPMPGTGGGSINWLQQGGDSTHSGNNIAEQIITLSNVTSLQKYPTGFSVPGSGWMSIGPIILTKQSNGNLPSDMAYVNRGGNLYAFPALGAAQPIWSTNISGSGDATRDTATPAIDSTYQYVYTVGIDGCVHKFDVAGAGEFCGPGAGTQTGVNGGGCSCSGASGWPQQFTAQPNVDFAAAALTIGTQTGAGPTPQLYVATTSNSDGGNYYGSVTVIDCGRSGSPSDGNQVVFNVFCADIPTHMIAGDCSLHGGSIWSRGGIPWDPSTGPYGRLYVGTSNAREEGVGIYDPPYLWGESLLALFPFYEQSNGDIQWVMQDNSTPNNPQSLSDEDYDLGSTNPLILHNIGNHSAIAAWAGKDGNMRLIDLVAMHPGYPAPGTGGELQVFQLPAPFGGMVTVPMAQWTNPADSSTWIFAVTSHSGSSQNSDLVALKIVLTNGEPSLQVMWQLYNTTGFSNDNGGGIAVANGIVYWALPAMSGGAGNIAVINPLTQGTNMAPLFSLTTDSSVDVLDRYVTPAVVNGALYVGKDIFTVNGTTPSPPTN